MEWAKKQRIYYVFAFLAVVGLLSVLPLYLIIHKESTCFDQKQNGDEVGVDCGGGCALYCASQVKPLRIVWAKAFEFAPEHYDIGAYLENPNTHAGIHLAPYTIRLIDGAGQTITERRGSIQIAPGAAALLFEGNFTLKTRPEKVLVDFGGDVLAHFVKARHASSVLVTKNQIFRNTDAGPRLDAVLVNTDYVNAANDIALGAVMTDAARNPIAISRTFVDVIEKGSEQSVFFTWPNPFSDVEGDEKVFSDIIIMQPATFD